jgi:hypothetical protein
MNVYDDYRWKVRMFRGGEMVMETVHLDDSSKDMEVRAAENLKASGWYDRIDVAGPFVRDRFRPAPPEAAPK